MLSLSYKNFKYLLFVILVGKSLNVKQELEEGGKVCVCVCTHN